MKKLFSVLLVLVAVLALTVSVSAASDINVYEQKIVDAVADVHEVDGGELSIPADAQNQVTLYLTRDGVDLTEEEANYIVEKIEACFKIVEDANVSDFDVIRQLPGEQKMQLLTLAQEAGAKINLNVAYDSVNHTLVVTEADGTEVATVSTDLKFTGADNTALVAIAVVAAVLLVGGALVAKKARLFA